METKICTLCNEEKPATSKHFYSNKKGKLGLSAWCKSCTDKKKKERLENNPEKLEEAKRKKREYQREYKKNHPENKQKYNEQQKIKRARKRKKTIRDKVSYSKYKEQRALKMREYYRTPMGRYLEYKRRGKRDNIEFDLTLEEFTSFWNLQCTYCGVDIDGVGLDRVDNTMGYSTANCVPCCSYCNRMKASRPLAEWLGHLKRVIAHVDGKAND